MRVVGVDLVDLVDLVDRVDRAEPGKYEENVFCLLITGKDSVIVLLWTTQNVEKKFFSKRCYNDDKRRKVTSR